MPVEGMRALTREAIRDRIRSVAVELFAERGFDAVTVEEIASTVGISARSFHRYFGAKEDVVVHDPTRYGEVVRDGFAARPADEPVWTSLRAAFSHMVTVSPDPVHGQRLMRVISSTPSLRAHSLEKHLTWARMLLPLVTARMAPGPKAELQAQTLIHAALACFDVALDAWSTAEDPDSVHSLLDDAFATLADV